MDTWSTIESTHTHTVQQRMELREERYLYHFPSKNKIKQTAIFNVSKINLLKEKKKERECLMFPRAFVRK